MRYGKKYHYEIVSPYFCTCVTWWWLPVLECKRRCKTVKCKMIQYHGATLPLICILLCCLVKYSYEDQVVVSTRHGSVRGFSIPSHYSRYDNRRINIFLGIPYAKRLTQYLDWRREFRFNVSDITKDHYFFYKFVAVS